MLRSFLRASARNIRAGFNKSVGNAFYIGFSDSQLHAYTAIDGKNFFFSKDVASQERGAFFKGKVVFNPVNKIKGT